MDLSEKVFVAGHNGMVGSAIVRGLKKRGYENILTRSRKELNLLDNDQNINLALILRVDLKKEKLSQNFLNVKIH